MVEPKIKKEIVEIDNIGYAQGIYDSVTLIPQITKREQKFISIIEALKAGKYYVLSTGYTKQSIYLLIKRIKAATSLDVYYGVTSKEGSFLQQFVLYIPQKGV